MPYYTDELTEDNSDSDYDDTDDDSADDYDDTYGYGSVFDANRRYLITYEIYNSNLHGCVNCDGQYLVNNIFKNTNYYKKSISESLHKNNKDIALKLRRGYLRYMHPFIRNYVNILELPSTSQVQIAQCIYLPGGELVSIFKTFYIRIIQRAWKKTFALRMKIQLKKRNIENILYRAKHGTWPQECLNMPSLKGLLIKPRQ